MMSSSVKYAIILAAFAAAVLPSISSLPSCSAQSSAPPSQPANTIGTLIQCATLSTPPSASAQQQAITSNSTVFARGEHTLTLTSTASTTVKPDEVTAVFVVHTEAQKAHDALGNNTAVTNQVRTAILKAGIPENQTQTTDFSISPDYNYQISPPLLTGFSVDNSIQVKTPRIENISQVIDRAVAAGANRVTSVDFGISDSVRSQTENALVHNAIQTATKQANSLAHDLGVKVVDVQTITSQVSSTTDQQQPQSPGARRSAEFSFGGAGGNNASIQAPSGLTVKATVFVTFVIEKA